MKNIVLLVHEDEGQSARVEAALDLVRGLDGHLRCVDVTEMQVFPGDFDGSAAGLLLAEGRKTEAANRKAVEARLAGEGVTWDFVDDLGDLAGCLLSQSRLADAIVVNCKRDGFFDIDRRGLAADLVTHARCPIVAVPDGARGLKIGGIAMVAWDASAPAATALRATTPLLRLADKVHIVTVGELGEGPSAEEAAAYLSRHGVKAEIHEILANDEPAPHLIDFAARQSVDHVVMGAYGHGRLAETIFGGVTQVMIELARLPLILAR
jgi:nucleotide-binding universal stress UspA family protein